jgi:hypothetical protein
MEYLKLENQNLPSILKEKKLKLGNYGSIHPKTLPQ